MNFYFLIVLAIAAAAVFPDRGIAQDAPSPTPPPPPAAASPASPPPTAPEQPNTGNPNLSVATVKMDGGMRASKVIGASVTNNANQEVGTVNDLVMDKEGHVMLGVVSLGGILGVGGKLVAVPYTSLHIDDAGKVTLPDGSKDSLNKMPGFTYTN